MVINIISYTTITKYYAKVKNYMSEDGILILFFELINSFLPISVENIMNIITLDILLIDIVLFVFSGVIIIGIIRLNKIQYDIKTKGSITIFLFYIYFIYYTIRYDRKCYNYILKISLIIIGIITYIRFIVIEI